METILRQRDRNWAYPWAAIASCGGLGHSSGIMSWRYLASRHECRASPSDAPSRPHHAYRPQGTDSTLAQTTGMPKQLIRENFISLRLLVSEIEIKSLARSNWIWRQFVKGQLKQLQREARKGGFYLHNTPMSSNVRPSNLIFLNFTQSRNFRFCSRLILHAWEFNDMTSMQFVFFWGHKNSQWLDLVIFLFLWIRDTYNCHVYILYTYKMLYFFYWS